MKCSLYLIFLVNYLNCFGQDTLQSDSVQKSITLDQVTVTATRTGRLMGLEPMPVLNITARQIINSGSIRLTDILTEQTGLSVIYDTHGTGLQVQGFDPDYTLILIDGEPAIGRTSGIFDLERITLDNISRIEIVKGPSSCLYGSEALAGVVNVITQSPKNTSLKLTTRYGTNQTSDVAANFLFKSKKTGTSIFLNRYQTSGYNLSSESYGKTVAPHINYTVNPKLIWEIGKNAEFAISAKYFNQVQQNASLATDESNNEVNVKGNGKELDYNLMSYLKYNMGKKVKNTFRYYFSGYRTHSELYKDKDNQLFDKTFFNQQFQRPELQTDIYFNPENVLTTGIGYIAETVEATRYDSKKRVYTTYGFAQFDTKPTEKLNMVIGTRLDDHSALRPRLSPKISARYDFTDRFALMGSIGTGFKSPDFRQLYLNFTNAVVGYSVYGAKEVGYYIAKLTDEGEISYLYTDLSKFGNLKPENSIAFNLGLKYKYDNIVSCDLNAFRNNVNDLIESHIVALRTNGNPIYSYTNLNKVYTQGLEVNVSFRPVKFFSVSSGYQFLVAKDEDVVAKIKNGEVFRRNPVTLESEKVRLNEYGGLFNRSRNTWNIKLFYDNYQTGTLVSFRAIYRGRYGFADNNSNVILDTDSEYAKGYVLLNMSVAQTIKKQFRLQAGCDNIMGYTDPTHTPGISGRLFYIALSYSLEKNKKQSN